MQAGEIVAEKYRLERRLGSGGFGDVWVAKPLPTHQPVAIKFLKQFTADTLVQRFAREAQALARLRHPHVVNLLDHGEHENVRFIVMELVDGVMLHEWLVSGPSIADRVRVAQQVMSALEAAHSASIVHRDLKPANVVIEQRPDGPHAVVLDFGIAKLSGAPQSDITKTGQVLGTPGYMSPEQVRGLPGVGPKTDLYALGVVLFEMFEGEPPFRADTPLGLAMQHLMLEPPLMSSPDAPAPIKQVVRRLLAKDPASRPASAGEVAALLEPAQTTIPLKAAAEQPRSRRGAALGLIALVAFASIIFLAKSRVDERPTRPRTVQKRTPSSLLTVPDVGNEVLADAATVVDMPPDMASTNPVKLELPIDRSCAKKPHETKNLLELKNGRTRQFSVILPTGYERERRHPLVVILHDFAQPPHLLTRSERLRSMLDARNMVAVIPNDTTDRLTTVWKTPQDRRDMLKVVNRVEKSFCIDERRRFIIGMGQGGKAAYYAAVGSGRFAALVTTAYRFEQADGRGKGDHRPPYLFTSPVDDRGNPVDGGTDCLGQKLYRPLSEHEELLRQHWDCTSRGVEIDGCWKADCGLEVCRAGGGRYWSEFGYAASAAEELAFTVLCEPGPPDRDYMHQAFEFFDRHDPARSEPDDSSGDLKGVRHSSPP